MNLRRFVMAAFALALLSASVAGSAQASPQADVMSTVHQYLDAFNKGDAKMEVAVCASPASIIDDFPPHIWQGPTACADWANAYAASAKQTGTTDGIVTMATPWHVDVAGDRAYVVVPVTFTYKLRGKPVTESGSIFTLALKKLSAGWRITGWAWAGH